MIMRIFTLIYSFVLALGFTALLVPAFALADGSQSYTAPGTYTFTVPSYSTLTVAVNGGGGGGGGSECSTQGAGDPGGMGGMGGTSSFGSAMAAGGTGAEGGANDACYLAFSGGDGSPGTASGGDTNTTGGGGAGGSGSVGFLGGGNGGDGGSGGRAVKSYAVGALTSGSTVSVIVGQAGAGGPSVEPGPPYGNPGTAGQGGSVVINWTGGNGGPTCAISFGENPLTDNSTTITWTSSGATLFYINNVGYVSGTGSAQVFSAGDYSGTVSGPTGVGSCAAVLQSPSGNTCSDGSPAPNGDPNQCTCAQGDQNACENSCPSGQTWNGTQCVAGCQTGYVLQNGECVFSECPLNYTQSVDANGNPICILNQCPLGYVLQNGQCVFQSCPVGYTQQGTQCVFQGCPSGYVMQGNFCVPITVQAPSADIIAVPSLVKQGQTSNISWNASGVSACSISGTNGDNWSCTGGACAATTTERSSIIQSQTIYSLSCTGLDASTLKQSVTVSVVPNFCETGAPGCN
jgi:hypothetical protein